MSSPPHTDGSGGREPTRSECDDREQPAASAVLELSACILIFSYHNSNAIVTI